MAFIGTGDVRQERLSITIQPDHADSERLITDPSTNVEMRSVIREESEENTIQNTVQLLRTLLEEGHWQEAVLSIPLIMEHIALQKELIQTIPQIMSQCRLDGQQNDDEPTIQVFIILLLTSSRTHKTPQKVTQLYEKVLAQLCQFYYSRDDFERLEQLAEELTYYVSRGSEDHPSTMMEPFACANMGIIYYLCWKKERDGSDPERCIPYLHRFLEQKDYFTRPSPLLQDVRGKTFLDGSGWSTRQVVIPLTRAYLETNQYTQASNLLQIHCREYPQDTEAWRMYLKCIRHLDSTEEDISDLSIIISNLDPTDRKSYQNALRCTCYNSARGTSIAFILSARRSDVTEGEPLLEKAIMTRLAMEDTLEPTTLPNIIAQRRWADKVLSFGGEDVNGFYCSLALSTWLSQCKSIEHMEDHVMKGKEALGSRGSGMQRFTERLSKISIESLDWVDRIYDLLTISEMES
ncbi:hypothetical protein PROFUN_12465 [Planoprotostelium fungivorum]|uniref:Uncharacterized protein n=1 Tax=Planoprotostelium fungivorum TaxID=1890364 RepID=A0A2P6N7D5_9EUKA|nr:hypothetical protein PROFUN_12465 [Planoprotostelium fungivorum]